MIGFPRPVLPVVAILALILSTCTVNGQAVERPAQSAATGTPATTQPVEMWLSDFDGLRSKTTQSNHSLPPIYNTTDVGTPEPQPQQQPRRGHYHNTSAERYHGAKEPSIGRRSDDPWDLARRLGIADNASYPIPPDLRSTNLATQNAADAFTKSQGCIGCHSDVGDMHPENTVQIGCTDCHGGNSRATDIRSAHVWPRFSEAWKSSANPVRSYTILNHESPEFVRFMNPGDLRVAHIACGQCHANEVLQNRKSMMTHGAMLWGSALYNNGSTDKKNSQFGESYSMNGTPQIMQTVPAPTLDEIMNKGVLPRILQPFQIQTGTGQFLAF